MSKVDVVSVAIQPRLRLNLIARVAIGRGEVVFECARDEVTAVRTWRTIQLGFGMHLKNQWLDYVDHSCEPNAIFDVDRLAMVALRPIAPGESISFFYPGAEVELAEGFRCHCGSPDCIGELRGGFYLSRERMRWAIDRGYCTRFMRERFVDLLGGHESAVSLSEACA
jgi:hypothetical protein